ncbi:hypothetical protein ACQUY5_30470 [Bacillus cereus]|uniref:hypothetical protein n=1 Tax=Bacillus cereus TaxID=1396 RepID=UPI003D17BE14
MKRDLLEKNFSSILDSMNMSHLATDDNLMADRICEASTDFEFVGKLLTGKEPHTNKDYAVEERMSAIIKDCISNLEDALRHMNDADYRYSQTVEEQLSKVIPLLKQIIG